MTQMISTSDQVIRNDLKRSLSRPSVVGRTKDTDGLYFRSSDLK